MLDKQLHLYLVWYICNLCNTIILYNARVIYKMISWEIIIVLCVCMRVNSNYILTQK